MNIKIKAFTLIELLVVIVIIGILATVSMATFGGSIEKAREAEVLVELGAIKKSMLAMKSIDGVNVLLGYGNTADGTKTDYCSLSSAVYEFRASDDCDYRSENPNPSPFSFACIIHTGYHPPDCKGGLLCNPYGMDEYALNYFDNGYNGPYLENIDFFIDPWDVAYLYQDNTDCTLMWNGYCSDTPVTQGAGVLRSAGPNKAFGDDDDILLEVCSG